MAIASGSSAAEAFAGIPGLDEDRRRRLESAEVSGEFDLACRDLGAAMEEASLHRIQVTLRVLPVVLILLAAWMVLRLGLSVLGGALEP